MGNPADTERNGEHDMLTPIAAQELIAELEAENQRLRRELESLQELYNGDRALLDSYMNERLPKTEEEFLRLASEGPTFRELLDEHFPELKRKAKP